MKFSIVVATYNRKDALFRCVHSVLGQTYQNFELLVVDDGSTDGTSQLFTELDDQRIRYIQLDRNHGSATPARNRGIDEMTGDTLIIWDSDDVLYPNALADLQAGFAAAPKAGVVCISTDFYRQGTKQDFYRPASRPLTVDDWFAGKKPKDAEIIALKKDYIGDVRFESRGIDFMFYAKIIGRQNLTSYYVNKVGGAVYLESDELSLTKARKKRNRQLSIARAPIIANFLAEFGDLYLQNGRAKRYAGYAFGAAVGFIMNYDVQPARHHLRLSLKYNLRFWSIFLYVVLFIPGSVYLLSAVQR